MGANKTIFNNTGSTVRTVGDIIGNRSVLKFSPKDHVDDILARLHKSEMAAGCVIDATGRFIGLVTEREIIRRLLDYKNCDFVDTGLLDRAKRSDLTAWDVMIVDPYRVEPDEDIEDALDLVSMHGFRYLPVVDINRIPKGIVDVRELYQHARLLDRHLLKEKDKVLSYFMGNEPYGLCEPCNAA